MTDRNIRNVTIDELPEFIRELLAPVDEQLLDGCIEDAYGDIVTVIGKAAAATAFAINNSKSGGLSNWQARLVCWEFMRQWDKSMIGKSGNRLINFDEMLYPQNVQYFNARKLGLETWNKLQSMALENLSDGSSPASPAVIRHWESIVAGRVPFGWTVDDRS